MCQIATLIYVHPSLLVQQRSELERSLESVKGVSAASFAAGRPHLLSVEYNPERLDAGQVIQQVKNYGVDANFLAC